MEHTLESVERRVTSLVAQTLQVEAARITPETNLIEDLGAESLDALTIALDVDKEFGIKVEDAEVGLFRTCREIASAVVRHLESQPALVGSAQECK